MELLSLEKSLKKKGFVPFPIAEELTGEEKNFRIEAECRFHKQGVYCKLAPKRLWIEVIGNSKKAVDVLIWLYEKTKKDEAEAKIQIREVEGISLYYLKKYVVRLESKVIAILYERRLNKDEIIRQKDSLKNQMMKNEKYVLLKKYYPMRTVGILLNCENW